MSARRDINEYLASEFGLVDVEASDDQPFVLDERGQVRAEPVFGFSDGDEEYYVWGGQCLRFLPVAGMSLADIERQEVGSSLIADQDPVDLSTSMPGHDDVPSSLERRKAIEDMCGVAGVQRPGILEGLFLRRSRALLALVRSEHEVVALHSRGGRLCVAFDEASALRRLAWAAAALLVAEPP